MCTLEFKAAVSLLAVEDSIIWLNGTITMTSMQKQME